MTPDEFRAAAKHAADWVAEYLSEVRSLPVVPGVKPGFLIDALPRTALGKVQKHLLPPWP